MNMQEYLKGGQKVYKLYTSDPDIVMGSSLADPSAPADGNYSLAGKDHAQALVNRNRLARDLNLPLDHWVFPEQAHTDHIYEVTLGDRGSGATSLNNAIPKTDALYSFSYQTLLAVMTADCVPILFYDTKTSLIGAIHSGWRGTVQNIAGKTIQQIIERHPEVDPTTIRITLGPSLAKENFLVDADVFEAFQCLNEAQNEISYDSTINQWAISNQNVVKNQLLNAGILASHIQENRIDTYRAPECFSYRQNKTPKRMMHFIFRHQKTVTLN